MPGGYDWVDVRDIVSAALNAIDKGRHGEKYILSGNFCTLKDLSRMISSIYNKKTPQILVPHFIAKMACPFIAFYSSVTSKNPIYTSQSLDILKNSPHNISSKKAQTELDFQPRDLMETLEDTINWYKQNNYLNQC